MKEQEEEINIEETKKQLKELRRKTYRGFLISLIVLVGFSLFEILLLKYGIFNNENEKILIMCLWAFFGGYFIVMVMTSLIKTLKSLRKAEKMISNLEK